MSPRRTSFDWLLEVFALVSMAVAFGTIIAYWPELPDRIPTHFNAAGEPDAYGGKNSLWFLAAVHAGVYLLATLAARYPRLINVPFEIDRNSPDIQRVTLRMANVTKAVVMVSFLYIAWMNVQTALGNAVGLGRSFLPIFLTSIFAPVVFYSIKLWNLRVR